MPKKTHRLHAHVYDEHIKKLAALQHETGASTSELLRRMIAAAPVPKRKSR